LPFPASAPIPSFTIIWITEKALDLLVEHGRLADIHPTMLEELRGNHEKNYAEAAVRGQFVVLWAHGYLLKPDIVLDPSADMLPLNRDYTCPRWLVLLMGQRLKWQL
jgi:hypothetical protein